MAVKLLLLSLCDRIVENVIAILGFPFFVFKKYNKLCRLRVSTAYRRFQNLMHSSRYFCAILTTLGVFWTDFCKSLWHQIPRNFIQQGPDVTDTQTDRRRDRQRDRQTEDRERERETDKQTDRTQTDRHTNGQKTDRETNRDTDSQNNRQKQIDRQTNRQRERQTDRRAGEEILRK